MEKGSKKILVHLCCAACASHVLPQLFRDGFKPVAFYSNPEFDQADEYKNRLIDIKKYCEETNVELIVADHAPKEFSDLLAPYKNKESIKYISDKDRYRRKRCNFCNSLMIQKTTEQTKKIKAKFFTTTLLCSPYKDHEEIVRICNERGLDYGLNFYYQDFRKGYWMGRNFARNHQYYIPSFCGCLESQKERRLE